jgi:hypothetical protein
MQAHVQHPDEYTAGAVAPQEALADLCWNNGREKKRSEERSRLRSERDHVFPLAPALSQLFG